MNPAWALLRLASPQLPIGGYSYSQGLEFAVERAARDAEHFGRGAAVFAAAAERFADEGILHGGEVEVGRGPGRRGKRCRCGAGCGEGCGGA